MQKSPKAPWFLLIVFQVSLLFPLAIWSQPQSGAIDLARMERDLDIMESILDKLIVSSKETGFFGRSNTRGSYLPGLGAVFQVSVKNLPPIVSIEVNSDEKGKTVVIHTEKSRDKTDTASKPDLNVLLDTVIEFLGVYADAMQELPDEERVVVILSARNYGTLERMFQSVRKSKTGQGFAVLAKRGDIKLYRKGKLSPETFRQRVRVVNLSPDTQRRPELQIFANVLETVFGGREARSFRLYGRVSYLYLPEFGALYSFDAMYTGRRSINVLVDTEKYLRSAQAYQKYVEDYQKAIMEYQTKLQSYLEAQKQGEASPASQKPTPVPPANIPPAPKIPENVWVFTTVSDSIQEAERLAAFQKFEQQIREYMLEYGRTLRLLKKNQWLVVSVKMRSKYEGIPERIVFQLKKSDLERYDSRRLSKKLALERIQVTYYDR